MVDKVHGTSFPGEHLTGNMDFFTVYTTVNITPSASADPAAASQVALDKLVETISMRAQPVIMGGVVTNVGTDPGSVPAYVSGNTYTFRFAVEHTKAVSTTELGSMLNGIAGFVNVGDATDNVVVVEADVL